jgi:hypothetical protein
MQMLNPAVNAMIRMKVMKKFPKEVTPFISNVSAATKNLKPVRKSVRNVMS